MFAKFSNLKLIKTPAPAPFWGLGNPDHASLVQQELLPSELSPQLHILFKKTTEPKGPA